MTCPQRSFSSSVHYSDVHCYSEETVLKIVKHQRILACLVVEGHLDMEAYFGSRLQSCQDNEEEDAGHARVQIDLETVDQESFVQEVSRVHL